MIEESAKVVSVDEQLVWVEASRHSACGQCAAKRSCSQKTLAEWAAGKMARVSVSNPHQLRVAEGDQVVVGIHEGSFVNASLLVYLLPLLALFFGGGVAQMLGLAEPLVIAASLTTAALGFLAVRFISDRLATQDSYQPVLISVNS